MINKEKLEVAMATVMPDAKSFEDMTDSVLPEWNNETSLIGIQAAKDGSGNIVGYCAHVAPKGYSAEIDMMVGINAQGEITDTSIISISDTPGIGTQVNEEEYKAQFVGKEGNLTAIKGSQAGNGEVLLISGATYSSTGFTNGVNAALQAYEMIVGEGA
jgi:electron transport complex protein RnfG